MTRQRAAKVEGVEVPDLVVDADPDAQLLVIGWGSSYGVIRAAMRRIREGGRPIASCHLHHLNPLPANTGDVLRSFPRVLCCEMNSGQLASVLRGRYLVDIDSHTKVEGQPLFAQELEDAILEVIG
jgi:2-oxoglutarate ferredoxin oxidoreductase subunit alpha